MKPLDIIQLFDQYLVERSKTFEAICIGGSALALLGVITRETQDCDILSPKIPEDIKEMSVEFSKVATRSGIDLKADWLNNGPASLTKDLPKDWETRTQLAYKGTAITLFTLGRADLLKSKLFALCDRAIDRLDCLKLAPTKTELNDAIPWLELQDGNPQWPRHVQDTISDLAKELGYEL